MRLTATLSSVAPDVSASTDGPAPSVETGLLLTAASAGWLGCDIPEPVDIVLFWAVVLKYY